MTKVLMSHSKLGIQRSFPERAVRIYERSGWELVDGHTPLSARRTGSTPPPLNPKKES